ncbi:MAG: hypothetical protein ACI4UB_02970, partial [Limosilactobacillus sp.]
QNPVPVEGVWVRPPPEALFLKHSAKLKSCSTLAAVSVELLFSFSHFWFCTSSDEFKPFG